VNSAESEEVNMFDNVVVATDLTATSVPAMELAARLVRASSGTLFVVHADEMPDAAKHWLTPCYSEELVALRAFVERHGAALRERLTRQVHDVLGKRTDLAVEPVFRWGRPAEIIVAEATRAAADVIVLGTRGSPLGSVSEVVVRTAGRPVLVVPTGTTAIGQQPSFREPDGPRAVA
jgi:nucleotide-binding universal stress UspA family protein